MGKYIGDITEEIDESWFVPIFEYEKGERRYQIILKHWIQFANRPDWYGGVWHKPIEGFIFFPGGMTKECSCMVTTLVAWLVTNEGRSFILRALLEVDRLDWFGDEIIISRWAIENQRQDNRRKLEKVFQKIPLPQFAYELPENLFIWVNSPKGRRFLSAVYTEIGAEEEGWTVPFKVPIKAPGEWV